MLIDQDQIFHMCGWLLRFNSFEVSKMCSPLKAYFRYQREGQPAEWLRRIYICGRHRLILYVILAPPPRVRLILKTIVIVAAFSTVAYRSRRFTKANDISQVVLHVTTVFFAFGMIVFARKAALESYVGYSSLIKYNRMLI